eukprot:NODE_9884_length_1393_cov_4.255924.p2 GENE.NODE_9884_length_1393_cov_4.255924~~NODE_9884_length_1393_cov_4.255924.p2  ORF type:complete len:210 (-),score=65.38 NODE_9884_length_1393_cov_4.255924:3-632(-)
MWRSIALYCPRSDTAAAGVAGGAAGVSESVDATGGGGVCVEVKRADCDCTTTGAPMQAAPVETVLAMRGLSCVASELAAGHAACKAHGGGAIGLACDLRRLTGEILRGELCGEALTSILRGEVWGDALTSSLCVDIVSAVDLDARRRQVVGGDAVAAVERSGGCVSGSSTAPGQFRQLDHGMCVPCEPRECVLGERLTGGDNLPPCTLR